MIYQKYNKHTGAWVKIKKSASGKTQILNVKQQEPHKKFVGVPVKK